MRAMVVSAFGGAELALIERYRYQLSDRVDAAHFEVAQLRAALEERLEGLSGGGGALEKRWLANDPQSFAAINRMLADSKVTEELPRIACPTLVIGCTHDRLRPPSAIEPMARQIPGAEYLLINSGHFAGIQTPGLVSQAFHGFLSAHGY